MDEIYNKFEKAIEPFLLEDIIFRINGKKIKNGQLLIYSKKNFGLVFTLQKGNRRSSLKLPIPFDITTKNNSVLFDYKIATFLSNNKTPTTLNKQNIKNTKKSKLYDIILTITKKDK